MQSIARSGAHRTVGTLLRIAVPRGGARRRLNALYERLAPEQQAWLHGRFARLFWGDQSLATGPDWEVVFAARRIRVPFAREPIGTAWNAAVSVLGHDAEVRRVYAALLGSPLRPRVMFDIGANLGFDSVLMLAHGVAVVSVEPNHTCHLPLLRLMSLNGLTADLRPWAVGAESGRAVLKFPRTETWLGSLSPEVQRRLDQADLLSADVEVVTLDELAQRVGADPDLIKIDTEGFELEVLRGGPVVLGRSRPLVLFESRSEDGNRAELFAALVARDYKVDAVGRRGPTRPVPDEYAFDADPASNFVALPSNRAADFRRLFR